MGGRKREIKRERGREKEKEGERGREKEGERVLILIQSVAVWGCSKRSSFGHLQCRRALSVPHSVTQSVKMRDYYINYS